MSKGSIEVAFSCSHCGSVGKGPYSPIDNYGKAWRGLPPGWMECDRTIWEIESEESQQVACSRECADALAPYVGRKDRP